MKPVDPALYQSLSPRQKEVATLIARGFLNKQIAGELGITEATIKGHRNAAYKTLRVHSTTEMAHLLLALGIIKPLYSQSVEPR